MEQGRNKMIKQGQDAFKPMSDQEINRLKFISEINRAETISDLLEIETRRMKADHHKLMKQASIVAIVAVAWMLIVIFYGNYLENKWAEFLGLPLEVIK